MTNSVIDALLSRRSVRSYTDDPVTEDELYAILEAGRWAPSGINNQPWRFYIFESPEKREVLAGFTHGAKIVKSAAICIGVFFDTAIGYDRTKDVQSIGACLQNMLLTAHSLGLGAVWLGEILKNKDGVRELAELPETLELMAVVAVGRPKRTDQKSTRLSLDDLLLGRS